MAKYRVLTDQGTFEVEMDESSSTPSEIGGANAQSSQPPGVEGFVKEHINPTSFPVISGLEKAGGIVKQAADTSFRNIINKPSTGILPLSARLPAEVLRTGARELGSAAIRMAPFTPSEFSMAMGAELAPGAMLPEQIAPRYGRAMAENVVPSTPEKIRSLERVGTFTGKEAKSAAQKIMDYPELGNTRDEILRNAHKNVQDIEGEIEAGLKSVKDVEIPKSQIAKAYDDVIDDLSGVPNARKDIRLVERLKKEFIEDTPDSQTIPEWNKAKRGIYKRTGDKGYIAQKPSVQVQVDKAVANRIKDLIGEKLPGIKMLGRKQGDMIDIRDAIIRSTPREVRDVSLTGPFRERAAIYGSRILSKRRSAPNGTMALGLLPDEISQE